MGYVMTWWADSYYYLNHLVPCGYALRPSQNSQASNLNKTIGDSQSGGLIIPSLIALL